MEIYLEDNFDLSRTGEVCDQIEAVAKECGVKIDSMNLDRGSTGLAKIEIKARETHRIPIDRVENLPFVARVARLLPSYKLISRKFNPAPLEIHIHGNSRIGAGHFLWTVGPCAVEEENLYHEIIDAIMGVKFPAEANMHVAFRGFVDKNRTSVYSWEGIRDEGLPWIRAMRDKYNCAVANEIMSIADIDKYRQDGTFDILQVGTRSAEFARLFDALAKTNFTVYLKNGRGNTIDEFLNYAERIVAGGNPKVVLVVRGTQTTNPKHLRNAAALEWGPVLRGLTRQPVVFDCSHSVGQRELVVDAMMAAVAAGFDGLETDVHAAPERAKVDGRQALLPEIYEAMAKYVAEARLAYLDRHRTFTERGYMGHFMNP